MAGIPMTVTAIPAYPTQLPFNLSTGLPPSASVSPGQLFPPIPDDLIVISARHVNAILPSLITASLALGMVVSDWSLHLPWEWRLIRTRKKWKLSHIAYFAARFGGLGYSISALLQVMVGNIAPGPVELGEARWKYADFACAADNRATTFFAMLSIAGSTGILLLRCLALYRFHIAAVISLGLLWIATPVFLIVNMVNLSSASRRNGISACDPLPPSLPVNPVLSLMPWFFLPVFDSSILILSLIGLRRASHRRRSSPLERMFRKDNIVYYAIVFLCVIPIPIWYMLRGRAGRMMPYLHLYIGISSVLSCRLFINLWKAIGRELALAQSFETNTRDHYRVNTCPGETSAGLVTTPDSPEPTQTNDRRNPDSISEQVFQARPTSMSSSSINEKVNGSHVGASKTSNAQTRSTESLQRRRRIVPEWADVDPDLACSLNGDFYGDFSSITYDYQSRGLHSTPY